MKKLNFFIGLLMVFALVLTSCQKTTMDENLDSTNLKKATVKVTGFDVV